MKEINNDDNSSFCFNRGILWSIFMGLIYLWPLQSGLSHFFGMIETAMIMTIYLNEAMNKMVEKHGNSSKTITTDILRQYIIDGSAKG
jgi:Cu(I)/Ag(I) efflux system membrane protein CusA/SilA